MFLEVADGLVVWQVLILAVVSLLVGALGGFIGLALGTMRLPALLLMGVNPATAAGVNILVSTLSALVGGYGHLRERRVDWRLVAYMGTPSVVGAFIGGFAGSSAPEGALLLVAGAFVFWQSVEFLVRIRGRPSTPAAPSSPLSPSGRVPLRSRRGAVQGAVGFIIGLVGGAVGLILGSVRLPLIIRMLHTDPRIAAGSNMMMGAFLGMAGFVGHGIQGDLDTVMLVSMAIPAMAGTYLGTRLTGRVSPDALIIVMSLVLLVVGTILMVNGVDRWVRD